MSHEPIDDRVKKLEDALVRVAATAPDVLVGDLVGTATLFALKLNDRARKFGLADEEFAAMEAVALASAACKSLLADVARANGTPKRNWNRRFR